MNTLKQKISFVSAVVLLAGLQSQALAIVAGFNQDIHMDIDIPGVVANDFHIEGRIKSGVPGGSWSQPPILIGHVDGGFPNFKHSILPDLSDPQQNSFIFRADFSGKIYTYCTVIHLGLFFDVTCHNIVIDLVGWWTLDGKPVFPPAPAPPFPGPIPGPVPDPGSDIIVVPVPIPIPVPGGPQNGGAVPVPGFEVEDRPADKLPQTVRIRNDSHLSELHEGGIPIEIVQMDLVGVSPSELELRLGPVPEAFEQLQVGGAQEELPWTPVQNEKGLIGPENPIPIAPDSFFDIFVDVDFGTHPSKPFRILPDEFLITRSLIRFTNNAGEPDFRWVWHVHQAHPPEEPPPVGAYDFGDAPDPTYPTLLASNGARHVIVPPVTLGFNIDPELDGQPNATATGDDNDGNDDEDGVVFTSVLTPGLMASVDVTAAVPGLLDAWIDFNGDGSWAQPGDRIFASLPLLPSVNTLAFFVHGSASANITTFARFRFSTVGGLSYDGPAPDGEVEDYTVEIVRESKLKLDFGDAPDQPYPTLLAGNGARHIIVPHIALGFGVDPELNGQPNATATGDDTDGNDDEDGVVFTTALVPGQQATVNVTATVAGLLDAWIDFGGDGSWVQPGDQIFAGVPLASFPPAINSLNFPVPLNAAPNITTYARFRFSSAGGLSYAGQAPDGEVEDYAVRIGDAPVVKPSIENVKWSQPPIEIDPKSPNPVYCGWDETSFSMVPFAAPKFELRKIVADDFRCLGTMPITSVHWWGSYEDWDSFEPPQIKPTSWLIGFWSNVPALPQADLDFSHPQTLLWQFEVSADRVSEEPVGIDNFPDKFSDTCFQHLVKLNPDEYFRQAEYRDATTDDVFWISIVAVYPDLILPKFTWGWKTRPWPWMDDAVTFDRTGELEPGLSLLPQIISPLSDSAICGEPEGYDMAFELDTDPDYIKWQQQFTGIRHWPHYEDEESMATGGGGTSGGGKWLQQPDLSERGLDVDATADFPPTWPPVTVADDFLCTTPGPLTDITIWSSFFEDQLPGNGVDSIRFTLSIYRSLSTYPINTGSSTPGELLWTREFRTGEYSSGIFAENLAEGWYSPALEAPNYQSLGDTVCWKYDFHIDEDDAFIQQGTPDNPVVYWLAVQGFMAHPPGSIATRFGWKTSPDHWNDGAIWALGEDTPSGSDTGVWNRLNYPAGHPLRGDKIDLAFAFSTQAEQQDGLAIRRLVADDWRCDKKTSVTAAVWWGSYIGYKYQACECPKEPPPTSPDYFLLSIWTDVPATSTNPFSHPREKIWECEVFDYDQVLVGYDKHPHDPAGAQAGPREPVFRYSARLPEDKWFSQSNIGQIYWFSVVAVYPDGQAANYPWGWTNHEHVFQDDAVAGRVDAGGVWRWETLEDQTGRTEDMSFVLFTDPR